MIAGRYEPLDGGLARDVELDRTVALRWLEPGEEPVELRISHPNVVRVYDVGEHEGRRFAAAEHVPGQPLTALGPLPAEEAIALGMQACRALAAAHELGLVHEGELLVRHDGVAKLSGFRRGAAGPDVRLLAAALNEVSPALPPLAATNSVSLARELERARPVTAATVALPAQPTQPVQPVPRPRRSRPRLPLVLAGLAALALAGGIAGLLATSGGGSAKPTRAPVARVAAVPHAATPEQQARELAAWLSRYSR